MASFAVGSNTALTLDEWDTLTVTGSARLQIKVGTRPVFETQTGGATIIFGPYGSVAVVTLIGVGAGTYIQQPSLTPVPVVMVDMTAAQIAAPSAAQLAATNVLYQINLAPYTIYQSNGTSLAALGSGGGIGTLVAATDYATAAIATGNTSIATAIANITPASPIVLGAGPTAITRAAHLNRSVTSAQAAATLIVFSGTATSGAVAGDLFECLNTGAGTMSASGTITATFGFKLTANTGEALTALYSATADAFFSTTVDPKALLASANNYALAQSSTLSTIAYAATVTIDGLTHSNHINIGTLTGNLFLANPTNWTNAGTVNIHSTQDATGSRLISFGTKFRAVGGIAGITLSTAGNAWDMLSFVYHPTKDLYFVAIGKGAA